MKIATVRDPEMTNEFTSIERLGQWPLCTGGFSTS
jgi:hypothetical protein